LQISHLYNVQTLTISAAFENPMRRMTSTAESFRNHTQSLNFLLAVVAIAGTICCERKKERMKSFEIKVKKRKLWRMELEGGSRSSRSEMNIFCCVFSLKKKLPGVCSFEIK
jgi:hypothetical protein